MVGTWKKFHKSPLIPYLGVAAHASWVRTHKPLIPKLYETYKAAGEFIKSHPTEAAQIIAKGTGIPDAVLEDLIESDRLRLNVYWAGTHVDAIDAVFEAGVKAGYLKKMPAADVVYHPAR
ncbi:MAG: hypothetical protein EPN41_05370 [Candidimonas sp.]|nr:MAG: hypothetical protein EPN41_05370 [Candidimonas sp.]